MSRIDWIVMSCFLVFVALYGIWKSRGKKDLTGYLLADRKTPWYTITLSIMATQASAITFLSTPGQAYVDGMRFVQFYFGLPIAMVILSVTAVPAYHKMKVYTAYEFLEQRFDLKNRTLGSILFLIQRGLAAGFTSPYAGPYFMVKPLGGPLSALTGDVDYAHAFSGMGA